VCFVGLMTAGAGNPGQAERSDGFMTGGACSVGQASDLVQFWEVITWRE
jgi:hypothetical protein